jgi:protein O-mannosyl-transferase
MTPGDKLNGAEPARPVWRRRSVSGRKPRKVEISSPASRIANERIGEILVEEGEVVRCLASQPGNNGVGCVGSQVFGHAILELMWKAAIALVVLTVAAYWGVWNFDFVRLDDYLYVIDQKHVCNGLTWDGVRWAFTTSAASNWHPLLWLSFMLDVELFGLNPGVMHAENLLLHIANALLLLLTLHAMAGSVWRSAFVAAVFALHPLHVESVAWISERKDTLSTFFALLTILAYAKGRYALAILALTFTLLTKSMYVTMPAVLLLLDYWPLKRRPTWWLAPMFVMALASAAVTMWATQGTEQPVILARLLTSVMGYGRYIWLTIYPHNLTFFYPYTYQFDMMRLGISAGGIIAVSVYAIRQREPRPWLAVGWFWFLGTLVPVIGIVQQGAHSIADRFMYFPLIGLAIIVAWWMPKRLAVVAVAVVLALAALTYRQSRHWRDTMTLADYGLSINPGNFFAHTMRAEQLLKEGRIAEAEAAYREADKLLPGNWEKLRLQIERAKNASYSKVSR